ncbi:MAG: radical SAM protein [Christensenellales bacterium]
MTTEELVRYAEAQAMAGTPLRRNEIVSLLQIPTGSPDDMRLRQAARRVAMSKSNGRAYIWSAIGADYAPCPMNCRFCSFGEEWGIVREPVHYSQEQIVSKASDFVKNGARFVVLRTTEFYSIPELLKLVKEIRSGIPGDYEIIFNTGEFDSDTARQMRESGVSGVYHACRLREGTDTPFAPAIRERTMKSVSGSGLKLISLVEPIGPEHTDEELADNFLRIVDYGAVISGAMARIPVPGTPLGDTDRISDSRLAQIIAVIRLSGGNTVRDVCVHPASDEALKSGANVIVTETGAIPRDKDCADNSWQGIDMCSAGIMLRKAGYIPSVR